MTFSTGSHKNSLIWSIRIPKCSLGIRDEGVTGYPSDEGILLSEGSRKKMKFSLMRLAMQICGPNFLHTLWVSALLLLLRTPGAHSLFS